MPRARDHEVTIPGERPGLHRSAVVNAIGSLVNGVLSAVIIALAARQGQTPEIAAYAVMTALLALVAGVVSGGSSLVYMTGDEQSRSRVRRHRLVVVAPTMFVAALVGTGFFYSLNYPTLSLLAVGAVGILNSLAELHFADLPRGFRFTATVGAALASKALATVLVLASLQLTFALLLAAAYQLVVLEFLTGRRSWLRLALRSLLARETVQLSMRPGLMLFSYAAIYTSRIAVLAVSLMAPRDVVGEFGVVLAIYQAIGAVTYSGLQVVLAARVRAHRGIDPELSSGVPTLQNLVLGTSALISVGLIVSSQVIVADVLRLGSKEAPLWLTLLALALPAFTLNRASFLEEIARDMYQAATRIAVAIAVTLTIALAIAGPLLGVVGAALATMVGEVLIAAALLSGGMPWIYSTLSGRRRR